MSTIHVRVVGVKCVVVMFREVGCSIEIEQSNREKVGDQNIYTEYLTSLQISENGTYEDRARQSGRVNK